MSENKILKNTVGRIKALITTTRINSADSKQQLIELKKAKIKLERLIKDKENEQGR